MIQGFNLCCFTKLYPEIVSLRVIMSREHHTLHFKANTSSCSKPRDLNCPTWGLLPIPWPNFPFWEMEKWGSCYVLSFAPLENPDLAKTCCSNTGSIPGWGTGTGLGVKGLWAETLWSIPGSGCHQHEVTESLLNNFNPCNGNGRAVSAAFLIYTVRVAKYFL